MSVFEKIFPSLFKAKQPEEIKAQPRPKKESQSGADTAKINAATGYGYSSNGNFLSTGTTGGSKWDYGLSASGASRVLDHATLRRNARDAYHDTPQARALVDRFADTVVDVGLMLEAEPRAEILGMDQEELEQWARNVEARFDSWARNKKQHRAENMTFYQAQRLYQIFQQRDNDIFTRLYYTKDRTVSNPVQFDFLDPEMVRSDAYTSTDGFSDAFDGIIRDDRGRETAYQVWVYDKKSKTYKMATIPRTGSKSGRVFVLHGFAPEYAGQGRGYSRLAHALQEFENLTDFTTAQIKKAINQSNLVFMMENADEDPSNPFEDILTNAGAGPASTQFGADPNPSSEAENVTDESVQPVNYIPLPEATLGAPGSTSIFNAAKGDKLKPVENTAPSDSFDKFVDGFTSYLSSASGMPLEVLLMKFNANYSASRASLILFWRIANVWRAEMAADFLNPVYEMWLSEEIAAGRVLAPGWSDPIFRAAWLNCGWIGAPMPNIDPMRTANADEKYVNMGATTLDRVSRNLNGSSGSSNRAKLKREFEELPDSPFNKNGGK